MASQGQAAGGGLGCSTVLFMIFLVLKLVGVIAWSWWWVTAPFWAPLALMALIFLVAFTLNAITRRPCRRQRG